MPPARKNRSAAPAVVCMAHKRREKTKAHAKHVENIGQFLQDRGSTPRASTIDLKNSVHRVSVGGVFVFRNLPVSSRFRQKMTRPDTPNPRDEASPPIAPLYLESVYLSPNLRDEPLWLNALICRSLENGDTGFGFNSQNQPIGSAKTYTASPHYGKKHRTLV